MRWIHADNTIRAPVKNSHTFAASPQNSTATGTIPSNRDPTTCKSYSFALPNDEVHRRTAGPRARLRLKHHLGRKFGISLAGEAHDRPIAQTLMINSQIGVMESGPVCPVAVVCGCRLLLQALVSETVHLANQSVNHRFESFYQGPR